MRPQRTSRSPRQTARSSDGRSPDNPVGGWYGLKKGPARPLRDLCAAAAGGARARRCGAQPEKQSHAGAVQRHGGRRRRRASTVSAGAPQRERLRRGECEKMGVTSWAGRILCVCVVALAFASCGDRPSERRAVHRQQHDLLQCRHRAELRHLAPSCQTTSIALPGYTLAQHWADGNALKTIQRGGWAYVVLQEQSQTPILDPAGSASTCRTSTERHEAAAPRRSC